MHSSRSAVGSWLRWSLALALWPLVSSCADRATTTELSAIDSEPVTSSAGADARVFKVDPAPFTVPTYDGSGQSVHPDVVAFDSDWHGARYWMTMTPYPGSRQTLENPSILRSDDGTSVSVPAGLTNPVVRAPRKARDYNSDPELLYDPSGDRLVLFYRLVEKRANTLHVSTSRDGVNWTPMRAPFWEHSHRVVSPTVAPRPGSVARMWYVDAGKAGCNAKSTSVKMRIATDAGGGFVDTRWLGPLPTDLSIPGYVIWHIKARWIPSKNEYWMLISAFPEHGNGCQTDDLFFARNTDGRHWIVYPEPVLRHNEREWTAAAVYRSTFTYDAATDEMRLWISARDAKGVWRIGQGTAHYSALLDALENGRRVSPQLALRSTPVALALGEQP